MPHGHIRQCRATALRVALFGSWLWVQGVSVAERPHSLQPPAPAPLHTMGVFINGGGDTHSRLELGSSALAFDATGDKLLILQRRGNREHPVLSFKEAGSSAVGNDLGSLEEQMLQPKSAGLTIEANGPLWVRGDLTAESLNVDVTHDSTQWVLAAHDTFEQQAMGWSINKTAPCGGPHHILGGPCRLSSQHTEKRFLLPPHRSVRIEARYYFIDEWRGYVGWMKIDHGTVWTSQHTAGAPPTQILR